MHLSFHGLDLLPPFIIGICIDRADSIFQDRFIHAFGTSRNHYQNGLEVAAKGPPWDKLPPTQELMSDKFKCFSFVVGLSVAIMR